MSCHYPLKAYWRNVNRDGITFDPVHSATKISFPLPCGRCMGCRIDKSYQWATRCLHEKKMWRDNSFVTLTYNDEFMPPGGSLCMRDVQLFLKRLRKKRNATADNPIRFFYGGEYGENNQRPHYHMLLFNCGFPDRVRFSVNPRGEALYTSRELETLWSVDGKSMGFCTIGEVTAITAQYCAKYALKKVTGDPAYEHYQVYDEYGEVHDRTPEFAQMSRRPGIGATYYQKYGHELRAHDNCIVNGREVPVPKYYDTKTDELDPARLEMLKRARKRKAVLRKWDSTPERLRVKARLLELTLERKKRKL